MFKAFAVVLIITISGCAVFDGGQVPQTTLSQYVDDGMPKPTLSYTAQALGGLATPKELPEATQHIIEGELLSVLESSGYFARISKHDEAADISVQVRLTNTGNPAAMIPAVITGLSLYAIPSWATDNYEVNARAERRDGLTKDYVLKDSATLVQWLPMIFVFPAKNFSVIPDVRKNMYRKLLSDMQDDGFFSDVESVVSGAE
jgi:hypothetical protein